MGLTSTLTGTIYRDDGAVATGAVVTFTLCAPRNTHWTSNNRVVLRAPLTATTDGSGNFSQVVARNDQLTPDNTYWKVECAEAALLKHIAANADTLDVIVAPDLDASAQVFSGLDDPDDDWVAHGHVQTLTAAEKLQAATNLGLNLSASQLLGQASSGGTGLPVAVTLGTGLAMSGATLNATVTGTANEITVTGTTTPTLSLPSALTFTGKTVTGGTFASPSLTTPTIGDGTESAPSLSFTSDVNTGVYRPAADTVGIVGGGNDVVRLTGIASATDYLEIKNGIGVGSPIHVLAEGASANIGVHLQPKGSGLFTISDGTDFNKGIRFRSSSSAASAITLLDAVSTAGRVVTLPDATGTLALVSGDLGTPSALVGTNITGTATGLTAGNATLAATVTVANEAADTTCFPLFATAATGSLAAKSNAGLTFNSSTGLLSATGLAGAFNGTVGATTPSTVAGTTGTFSGVVSTTGANSHFTTSGTYAQIYTTGANADIYTTGLDSEIFTTGNNGFIRTAGNFASIYTDGTNAPIYTTGTNAYIQTRSTFKLNGGTFVTTLSHAATANRAIAFPDAPGTLALVSGDLGTPSAIVLTNATGTAASLTAGTVTTNANLTGHVTSVGNAAVLGSFTMAQLSAAVSDGDPAYVGAANTFTGTTNTFTLPTTTGTTTTSGIAVAANSLTTGTGADFSSTSASMTAGSVVRIAKTGAGTLNKALILTSSGGTTNTALDVTAGHVLVPDGSYVYNTSVSPSIGRSAVAATATTQAGLLLGSGGFTMLASSIRGFSLNGTGAFGNSNLISGVGTSITFSTAVISTSVIQAGEDKTSTPSTGTVRGGSGSGTNIAGGELHIIGGASTGSAAGGSILLRTTPAGASGSAGNAAVTAITIDSTQAVTLASTLAVTGATTLTGNLTSNGALISVPQALSGNGAVAAVNLTTLTTTIANTGTANTTTTLAAGTNGQTKIISFITDGGFDAVVTVTNPAWGGAGTITMNDALDNVMLIYLNSVWQVFINNGCTLA